MRVPVSQMSGQSRYGEPHLVRVPIDHLPQIVLLCLGPEAHKQFDSESSQQHSMLKPRYRADLNNLSNVKRIVVFHVILCKNVEVLKFHF